MTNSYHETVQNFYDERQNMDVDGRELDGTEVNASRCAPGMEEGQHLGWCNDGLEHSGDL